MEYPHNASQAVHDDLVVLAFEGGATHTKAAVVRQGMAQTPLFEAGPCNPTAYGVGASVRALVAAGTQALAAWRGPTPSVAAIGSAGAVDDAQRRALGEAICRQLGTARAVVATDLHPLLLANAWQRPGILCIAGTGSNVLAQDGAGHLVQVGGRGTLLGDDGSGYMIAYDALRAAARARDGWGPPTVLETALPEAAGVPHFDALIAWGASASKRDIAVLCQTIFACAAQGDAVAQVCIAEQAQLLAEQVLAAAARLGAGNATLGHVFGVGGLFERYPVFIEDFNARLAEEGPLRYVPPPVTGPAAVAVLARLSAVPAWAAEVRHGERSSVLPSTEATPQAPGLDALPTADLVRAMLNAEATVSAALTRQAAPLTAVVQAAADSLAAGGRILYFGAGTSGRLGVLDASECGPTFGVGPETIDARIAGGDHALRHAVEGAEDDPALGAEDVVALAVGPGDLVIGIAASGRTPYVGGVLEAAHTRGARTALVCCVDHPALAADLIVALDTGAEVLPGSTRLKAGTATKIALNVISTGALARSGRVFEGKMVAMRASNTKLRARAARMVAELTGQDLDNATQLLEVATYDIRAAILMGRARCDVAEAQRRLTAARGDLRRALDEETADAG